MINRHPSNKNWHYLLTVLLCLGMLFGCSSEAATQAAQPETVQAVQSETEQAVQSETAQTVTEETTPVETSGDSGFDLLSIPAYSGSPYTAVHNNEPYFTAEEMSTEAFETYSDLDSLGRCGVAYANVCMETMPTEKRGSISEVKPTGWHSVKYDNVDGKSLYNRCHLIGYQLTAENANKQNLITGTRYLNVDGMLPFENMVADYVKETNNHVLYRVTPIFTGDHLVADGVLMEGYSVEDEGDGICFCVYAYNVQPGITIDYATGDSWLSEANETEANENDTASVQTEESVKETATPVSTGMDYILNTNTKKFHYPSCSSVKRMKEANKKEFTGSRDELIKQGYDPCKKCNP